MVQGLGLELELDGGGLMLQGLWKTHFGNKTLTPKCKEDQFMKILTAKILAAKISKMHMKLRVNLRATMKTLTIQVKKRIVKALVMMEMT